MEGDEEIPQGLADHREDFSSSQSAVGCAVWNQSFPCGVFSSPNSFPHLSFSEPVGNLAQAGATRKFLAQTQATLASVRVPYVNAENKAAPDHKASLLAVHLLKIHLTPRPGQEPSSLFKSWNLWGLLDPSFLCLHVSLSCPCTPILNCEHL